MNKEIWVALDYEWQVEFYSRPKKKKEYKVGLIQLAYCNKEQNDRVQYLLLCTHKLRKLPGNLVSFLQDNSFPIVAVNIGGDIARIGRDFGVQRTVGMRCEDRIINLGTYARKSNVVQNGTIGLKELTKLVLSLLVEKYNEVRFSNWNANELSDT